MAVAGEVTEDYIGSLEGKQQTSVKVRPYVPALARLLLLFPSLLLAVECFPATSLTLINLSNH